MEEIKRYCFFRACLDCATSLKNCPVDSEVVDTTFRDNVALREIITLECYCIHKKKNCLWSGNIVQLEDHLNICIHNENISCVYSQLDCDFKGGDRTKIKEHYQEKQLPHTVSLVTAYYKNIVIGGDLQALSNENDEKIEKCNEYFQSLKEDREYIESSNKEYKELNKLQTSWTETSFARLKEFKNSVLDLPEHLKAIDELTGKIEEIRKRIEEKNSSKSKDTDTIPDNIELKIDDKLAQLEAISKETKEQTVLLDRKIRAQSAATYDGHVIWRVDDLKQRILDAVQDSKNEIISPPFYTDKQGYKFCLLLYLRHQVEGVVPPYMSLYLALLPGEYDDLLKFPFPYATECRLKNQSGGEDLRYFLLPDASNEAFDRVFKNNKIRPIGFSQFIDHEELHSGGFIRDDCIYFQIAVEVSDDEDEEKKNIYVARQVTAVQCLEPENY